MRFFSYKKYLLAGILFAIFICYGALAQNNKQTLISVSKPTKVTVCVQGRGTGGGYDFIKFIFNNDYSDVATGYKNDGEYLVPASNGEQLSHIVYIKNNIIDTFAVNSMTYVSGGSTVPNNMLTGEDVNICLDLGYALKYYELYQSGASGYYSPGDMLPTASNTTVTNDGYCIEFPAATGAYAVNIIGTNGNNTYNYNLNSPNNWDIIPANWKSPQAFTDAMGSSRYRIYLPNSVVEAAGTTTTPINIKLTYAGVEVLSSYVIPRFPLEIYSSIPQTLPTAFNIRSPRHIANINGDTFSPCNYTQILDIDFNLYRKGVTVSNTVVSLDNTTQILATTVIVNIFKGVYDGQAKLIKNVVLNRSTNSNVGIFGYNSGTIQNVIVQNPTISGQGAVGGIAGANVSPGKISNSSVQFVLPATGNTLKITATSDYLGGIVGSNELGATIEKCFIKAMPASGAALNKYPMIVGAAHTGGITGINRGSVSQCYVDFVQISGTYHVGGVVGYNEGNISSVFYNYGDNSPQSYGFINTIVSTTNSTSIGGIVGTMISGTLSNSYSTAAMSFGTTSTNNYITGAKGASANITNTYYLYKQNAYNHSTSSTGGSTATIEQLRGIASAGNVSLDTDWVSGPGYNSGATPGVYPYPILNTSIIAENTPGFYPMPSDVYYGIEYYEKYSDGSYKTWSLFADNLDNNKKILEDGYVIRVKKVNQGRSDITLKNISGATLKTLTNQSNVTIDSLYPAAGESFFVISLDTLEKYAQSLVPIRITVDGPPGNTIYYDGYVNPLYAKAIFETLPSNSSTYYDTYEYKIRTPRHLQNIAYSTNTLKGVFRQDVDIDYSGLNTNSGYWKNPDVTKTNNKVTIGVNNSIVYKSGSLRVFQGAYTAASETSNNIYAIKNVNINISGNADTLGIFNTIGNTGRVKILRLENNSIRHTCAIGIFSSDKNNSRIGGLAGVNLSGGQIDSVFITNSALFDSLGISLNISSASNAVHIGGIVGDNAGIISNSNINSSTVEVKVATWFDVTPYNSSHTGGAVGHNHNTGTIEKLQLSTVGVNATGVNATGVNNGASIAGVVGYNGGTVRDVSFVSNKSNSPVTQTQTMTTEIGGIVGANTSSASVTRALYIARSPVVGSTLYPLIGGTGGTLSDSYFLIGTGYNTGNYGGGVTTANNGRTTNQLITNSFTSNWNSNWSVNWRFIGVVGTYPYPWLNAIPEVFLPAAWPTAN